MKVKQLRFVTDSTQLKPDEGKTMPYALKQALIQTVSAGLNKPAPSLRILWRTLDELDASGDSETVQVSLEAYDLLKEVWEAQLAQVQGGGWRWYQAIDKIILGAEDTSGTDKA